MKISRRQVLRGLGGAALSLPLLESFARRPALAQELADQRYAIFLRQANGVAAAQNSPLDGGTTEPERFWPRSHGALTTESMQGRAVDELTDYRDRLLVLDRINMYGFNYGDGHARGAMQGLTARGAVVAGAGGESEADGESIDHRIGRELNPGGRDSLFMYAGRNGGWLGGPCISYRGAGQRRAALRNPKNAYEAVAGVQQMSSESAAMLASRRKSLNDLVRDQMQRLLGHPRLSSGDRQRLDLHFSSIRDVEVALSCGLDSAKQAEFDGAAAYYDSNDGRDVMKTLYLHMDIAAMAVACGYTRSVALQVGSGNDGSTRYYDDTGQQMENYHYVSHRRLSHDNSGGLIAGSDQLHHQVDRTFGRAFKHLLDRLDGYALPDGQSLLQHGASVWYNDNGNGPGHSSRRVPFIVAGSANGYFKQGQNLDMGTDEPNHAQLLNTIASSVGVTNESGTELNNFGDSMLPGGTLAAIKA